MGGTFDIVSPSPPNMGGTRPPVPPLIDAHAWYYYLICRIDYQSSRIWGGGFRHCNVIKTYDAIYSVVYVLLESTIYMV